MPSKNDTIAEVTALIDSELAAIEDELTKLAARRFEIGTQIEEVQARTTHLRRLKHNLAQAATPPAAEPEPDLWGMCLVEDLVAGDVFRFGDSSTTATVAQVTRNREGRLLVRHGRTTSMLTDGDAVHVRYPRPRNAGMTEVAHLPGIGVVDLGGRATVAEMHEAIAGHVGEPETAGVGR